MTDSSRVRVSIVGVVVVALFSTLLARLWFLQSGAESSLRVQADIASTRVIQTESPRGEILDRNGVVLVKDRPSWAVTVDRTLSKKTTARVLGQLAEQLGIPVAALQYQYTSVRQSPLKPAVVALDVSQENRLAILQDRHNEILNQRQMKVCRGWMRFRSLTFCCHYQHLPGIQCFNMDRSLRPEYV